jgi:catalase
MIRQKIHLTNDFVQAGERYRSLDRTDQDHLVDNIVSSLGHAEIAVQEQMVTNLTKADLELGKRVSGGLGLKKA